MLFGKVGKGFSAIFYLVSMVNLVEVVFAFTVPLVAYNLASSASDMGLVRAAEFLPHLILSVFIGVLVDNFDKKKLIRLCLVACTIIAAAFPIVISHFEVDIYFYAMSIFLISALVLIVRASINVTLKESVDKDLLIRANSKIQSTAEFLHTVGPILSGFVFYLSFPKYGFYGCAVGFVIALLVSFALKSNNEKSNDTTKTVNSVLHQLVEGFSIFKKMPKLIHMSLIIMFVNAIISSANLLNIFVIKDELKLSDLYLGIAVSIGAVGAFLGGITLHRFEEKISEFKLIATSLALSALGYIFIYSFKSYTAICFSMFLEGLSSIWIAVTVWTYRQKVTSSEVLGRISGITGMIFKVLVPVGLLVSTWYVDIYNSFDFYLFTIILSFIVCIACLILERESGALEPQV
ncbi:MFS transporter [Pseudoalteromonas byunsanensis]|uniref:Major facilitator superfamily (MFS) profile domain-containing protein n=1 Tax=Pseudoalteromonas byunsanensis TaxID=327939 RepID=A0A1S1N291_9GAMM|nr:MFS transporter [Pseudoalteromonas byunsanensis]OHU95201.1 hypothetical protein BIW53_10775 [Pseudoalteromonas byunsanensis]